LHGTDARDKLIVALDVSTRERLTFLVDAIGERVLLYKVGLELFTSVGAEAVSALREKDKKVFLDLKLHDIPKTVERAAAAAARLGASMTTVHSLGGADVIAAAREGLEAGAAAGGPRPLLIAVTLLTSHREEDLKSIFTGTWQLKDKVLELAEAAARAGADGVVCSPREVAAVKSAVPRLLAVTPGVRLAEVAADDQRRTGTPAQAIADGADYLVVGRPICSASDPAEAASRIVEDMETVLGRR
jgi:orotidine-5'-phosphate decarboxylase